MKRLITLVLAMSISPLVLVAQADPLPAKPFFEEPLLFGVHRGGAKWRPESTLKTFQEAAKTWPGILLESDVRMTADGVVVMLHDATVDRTTNGKGAIADLTWDFVETLDAGYNFSADGGETYPYRGKGYRIPKLRDVLRALPESRFLIEFKDQPGIVDAAVRVMQKSNAVDRILVASFKPEFMTRAVKIEPRLATCFDTSTGAGLVLALRDDKWETLKPARDVFIFNYRRIERYRITPEDFPRLKAKGIPLIAYTLNDPDQIREAINHGVTGILTDRPDIMSEVLETIDLPRKTGDR
jgi:glycerophosphoryl diester phosphodiesterase